MSTETDQLRAEVLRLQEELRQAHLLGICDPLYSFAASAPRRAPGFKFTFQFDLEFVPTAKLDPAVAEALHKALTLRFTALTNEKPQFLDQSWIDDAQQIVAQEWKRLDINDAVATVLPKADV